jgi:hypothetical protein
LQIKASDLQSAGNRGAVVADVFISYKREDEAVVGRLVKALRGDGLSVWWDRDIPTGAPWEDTIEREHEAARALVVCWSRAAVASENVKAEARRARSRNSLVQTFVEPCEPPMFFGERQGVDLSGWSGRAEDPRFKAVAQAVRAVLEGRDADTGVGAAVARSPRRNLLAAAAVLALLLVAGVGTALYVGAQSRAAAARARAAQAAAVPSPAARLLAGVNGRWGVQNGCDRAYRYSAVKDAATGQFHIVAEGKGFRSEGRVVSVADGVILSEALTPASDRGNLVEIRPEPGQLVLQDRRTDTRQVLVRCS